MLADLKDSNFFPRFFLLKLPQPTSADQPKVEFQRLFVIDSTLTLTNLHVL